MTSTLTDFLIDVGGQPDQALTLLHRPEAISLLPELTAAEKEALRQGDVAQIQTAAGRGLWDKLIARGVFVMEDEDTEEDEEDEDDTGKG